MTRLDQVVEDAVGGAADLYLARGASDEALADAVMHAASVAERSLPPSVHVAGLGYEVQREFVVDVLRPVVSAVLRAVKRRVSA